MFSFHNLALVLVRFFGGFAVVIGVMWLVNIVCSVALIASHAPEWLTSAVWIGNTTWKFITECPL